MLPVIIRAVIFGLAVYLLSKLGRNLIDKWLDTPKAEDKDSATDTERSHLIPCPECGVYYDASNPSGCSKCNESVNDD